MVYINFFAIVQAVHQQAAKFIQQHWSYLNENYDLNSAFEKTSRLLE
jgi:hypothetical protein